ncbi:MAG: cyclic nucleotide-binding domain-containing protein [Thermodesulfobacteriota bacterium]
MEDLNLLKKVPLFSDLPDQDLKVLAEVGHEEHYPQDSIIIDEGEINNSLYFLVAGQVKVCLEKISGRPVTLSVLKKGSLFGEVCLIGNERPSPKVVALTDTTLIRFEKNDFLHGISNDPVILANILRETCFRQSHNTDNLFDNGDDIECESKLHKEISIFEKRFAIELEGIKLISKKIEDISNDTSSYIKDKSEETISWVEQRSKEAIESSEKRSLEVTERAEKQARLAIDLAEKTIAKALEEANTRTEAMISQIEKAIISTRAETEASIKKVELFWNNIKKGVVLLSSGLAILGSILVWLGYPEFKRVMEVRENIKENQEYIEKIKKNVELDSSQLKDKMQTFKNQLGELAALKAMVLTIGRIRHESQLGRDEVDSYKKAHITYNENREKLLIYFSPPSSNEYQPEVIVEALNNFLHLIYYSNFDTIKEKEKNNILSTCRESLTLVKNKDFRYRLKVRENLIIFGQILKKRSPDFYNDQFIPTFNSILIEKEVDDDAKFTVAEVLAALGEGSDECVNFLVKYFEKTDKKWRRASAAVSLLYLKNQKGHDYLFNELKQPHGERREIAVLTLGEAVAKSDAISLDDNDRRILLRRIEEEINLAHNRFRKDYAEAILKKLKEKETLRSAR